MPRATQDAINSLYRPGQESNFGLVTGEYMEAAADAINHVQEAEAKDRAIRPELPL